MQCSRAISVRDTRMEEECMEMDGEKYIHFMCATLSFKAEADIAVTVRSEWKKFRESVPFLTSSGCVVFP